MNSLIIVHQVFTLAIVSIPFLFLCLSRFKSQVSES